MEFSSIYVSELFRIAQKECLDRFGPRLDSFLHIDDQSTILVPSMTGGEPGELSTDGELISAVTDQGLCHIFPSREHFAQYAVKFVLDGRAQ